MQAQGVQKTENRKQINRKQIFSTINIVFPVWFICEIYTFSKNSPPRRTRRGPPLFEKRLVPGIQHIFLCSFIFNP